MSTVPVPPELELVEAPTQKPRSRFGTIILPWIAAAAASLLAMTPILEGRAHFVGQYLSWPIYNGFLLGTIAAVTLPYTRLFPSVQGMFWRGAGVCFDALISVMLISQGGKAILRWPRPSGSPSGAISGHTMTAFVCAWLLSTFYPRLSIPAFTLAVFIGWSRIQTNDHFHYQVFLGAVLGNLVGYAATQWPDGLIFRRLGKWMVRKFRRNSNGTA